MATDTQSGFSANDLTEAMQSPSSFSTEGLSQSNRSISELIQGDRYLRKISRRGIRVGGLFKHMIPPGTCDR